MRTFWLFTRTLILVSFLLSFTGRELVSLNIENLGKFFSIKKKELMEEKK